jgi:hypothetical protein
MPGVEFPQEDNSGGGSAPGLKFDVNDRSGVPFVVIRPSVLDRDAFWADFKAAYRWLPDGAFMNLVPQPGCSPVDQTGPTPARAQLRAAATQRRRSLVA